MIEWTVTDIDAGDVLSFLQHKIPTAPRSYLRQLLRAGKIRGLAGPLQEESRLRPGDRIQATTSARLDELLRTAALPPLEILFETRELLIVAKPAGLAVHSSKGHETDNLQSRVQTLIATRNEKFSVAPIHRLDLETSGPVLFGKGRKAASELGKLFMSGQVQKRYLALAVGALPTEGVLNTPVETKGKLKEAATAFLTLASAHGFSLLDLSLHTGRTHQIRRQLTADGHPLVGDRRYGGPLPPGLKRMFLHCRQLELPDPFGGPNVVVVCPLPDDLRRFLRQSLPILADAYSHTWIS